MTDMTASVIDDFIYIVGGCKNNDGLIPVDGYVNSSFLYACFLFLNEMRKI